MPFKSISTGAPKFIASRGAGWSFSERWQALLKIGAGLLYQCPPKRRSEKKIVFEFAKFY
jgi:hypothetical protein